MDLLEQFKEFILNQKNKPSPATVKNYKADVGQFITWYQTYYKKSFKPAHVTPDILKTYQTIKKTKISSSSVERHLSSLRKFFHFLKIEGLVRLSPFEPEASSQKLVADSFHLSAFKNHLYVYNASNLTIKNYLMDIRQFLKWAQ